jgi:hypothetical protein
MTRLLSLLILAVALTGCKSTYQVRDFHPSPAQLRSQDGIYIIVPPDGPDEPGCGRLAADTLYGLFAHRAERVKKSDELAPFGVHLTNAANAGFVYVLQSKITLWKEEATEWSGLRDKLDMNLSLLRAANGEVVSETHISGQSKLMSWGGDRVEHLLTGIGGKWVGSLYGEPGFEQTPPPAAPSTKSK